MILEDNWVIDDDLKWWKENMKFKRGNAIKNKRKQVSQLWHIVVFWQYLELQWSNWDDSWTILDLRDRSTFGMKNRNPVQLSSLSKSRHTEAHLHGRKLNNGLTSHGILIISQSTELQIEWFLRHWKINSKGYNFHVLYKS